MFLRKIIPMCAQPTLPNLSTRPNVEVSLRVIAQREAVPGYQPDTPVVDVTPTSSQPIDSSPNVDVDAAPSDTPRCLDVEARRGTQPQGKHQNCPQYVNLFTF